MGIKAKNMDFKIKHMDAHMGKKKGSWLESLLLHFVCLYARYGFLFLPETAVCRQSLMLEIHMQIHKMLHCYQLY